MKELPPKSNRSPLVRQFQIKRADRCDIQRVADTVAVEEPLEIRVKYWFKEAQICDSLAVTMRSPGHDRELAAGFLLSEGVINTVDDLADLYCLGADSSNEIVVELAKGVDLESWRLERRGFVHSSCGICGKRTLDTIPLHFKRQSDDAFRVNASLIGRLPSLMAEFQPGFAKTGGLHAAALMATDGQIEAIFEDIGRHNALDKLIGHALMNRRVPLSNFIIFLSSRGSFELVQKALAAGSPLLATVGGPSSLAIQAAREYGLTLLGFVRGNRFNIYSGDWRINSIIDEASFPQE